MNKQKVAQKFDLLIILAVAIPVLAISVIITGYLLHQYVDDVHEKDALHLKGLVSSVQWFLDNAFSLNYQLSINPQILEQIASAEKDWGLRRRLYNEQYGDGPFSDGSGPPLLVEMQKKYDFLDLLFVQDADGNQAGRSFGALGKRGERWWFKKIMGDDKPRAFVSRSYYSITGAKPVASVFHPIHQGDRLVGVMGADINFEKLQKVVQSYLAAKDLYAIVLDNQGVIIAHPISAKVREMHNLKKLTRRILLTDDAGRPIMGADGYHKTEEAPLEWDQRASLLTSEVLMGRSGIFQDISMDRQNLTIYYEPVALPGDGSVGNYAILLVRDNSTIFRAKITICVFVFLFTILTILVLIFSFRLRFRAIILLPLKKLSESMKDSDVVHPKPVDLGGDDELDALARTYNQMRQNLAESNRKLGELNEKLEQRVEERTSELKRANEKLSRDILEREKVEADLRRSEELHRGTLEATPDAIIISRLKDGRYLQVNEAFCRYSGYSREEALGQTTADLSVLVNSGDREDIIRAVKEKGEVNGVEIQCRSKSGQAFDGLLSARRLRSGDEERILTVVTNISRIKLAEKEKRALEKQLMHSRKLESIGTIASGVAHNFRNILNGVSIHNQIIELRYGDFEPLMEISEKIARLVKRGARLVDGLSQFSRKDGGKEFKTVNLSEIVQDVYYMIKKSLDARIDVQMDLDPMVYVTGDAPGLSQVLMNLCNNARDAMPDGGALRITVSKIDQLAKVIISDSGVGMDEETLQKCFDPFFTTKSIDKGSGLGLSTSYGVIKTHGGEIQVSSRQGEGTDFIIVLPGTDVEEEDENEALAPGVIRGNGEKILVVDDDQNWRKPAVVLLKSMGYKAFMAKSGDKALSIYAALKPDIILLDINMPEMDGVTCAEKILKQTPDARIILVSGYDKQTFESLDNHAGDWIPRYISKPIDMLELSRLLDRLLHDGKS